MHGLLALKKFQVIRIIHASLKKGRNYARDRLKQIRGHVLKTYLLRRHCMVIGFPIHVGRLFPRIHGTGQLTIGDQVKFRCTDYRHTFFTRHGGHVVIGARTSLNQGLNVASEVSIEIGEDCRIGEQVSIFDTSFHPVAPNFPTNSAAVKIGRNVWIGHGVIILPGVEIGDHSVIGAGAVVPNDIPPRCVAVGVPAKVVSNFECEDDWRRG